MTDFDVGPAADDADEPDDEATGESDEARVSETREPTPDPDPEPADDAGDASEPAFEYADVRQKPLYARAETWDELEDQLGIEVTPEFRRIGIRNEETREIHDALLEIAIDHIDELPERVADKRRRR